MQILATGTRDVEIIAPLKVKTFSSTFENGRSVGTGMPTSAIALAVAGQGAFSGNVTMFGNLTVNGSIAAKPYVSLCVLEPLAVHLQLGPSRVSSEHLEQ